MQWGDSAPAGAQAPVARIVYASQARFEGSVYTEMERIRASAVRHNVPVGIATALLYQAGWFVQWKEGSGDALLQCMDRVAGDPRHADLRIIHSSRGPRLLDGPWSMAVVHARETPQDMQHRVARLRRQLEQGAQFAPPAVWRRLSTPMCHRGAMRQEDPEAFQRVLVCSAAGTSAYALARWLAMRHREELVHRRFSGAVEADVATDYVDFGYGARVMRLIAMARNGLRMPLTRAFLPDYSHVVLLLSGDAERDLSLVEKVLLACGRLARPPALLAVAASAASHRAPFTAARRHGLVYLEAVAPPDQPALVWRAIDPVLECWQEAADSGVPLAPLRRLGGEGAGQEDAAIDLADVGAAAEGH